MESLHFCNVALGEYPMHLRCKTWNLQLRNVALGQYRMHLRYKAWPGQQSWPAVSLIRKSLESWKAGKLESWKAGELESGGF